MTRVPDSAQISRRPRLTEPVDWGDPIRGREEDRGPLLSRVSIAARLYGLSTAFVLGFLLIGFLMLWARATIGDRMDRMFDGSKIAADTTQADVMNDAIRQDMRDALAGTTPAQNDAARAAVIEHTEQFQAIIDRMAKTEDTPTIRAEIEALRPKLVAYSDETTRMVHEARDDHDKAESDGVAFKERFEDVERGLRQINTDVAAQATELQTDIVDQIDSFAVTLAGLVLLAAAFGTVAAIAIGRSIVRPLASAVSSIDALSQRDCTYRAEVAGSDEVAAMSRSLNRSLASTADAITTIRQSAAELATNAGQVMSIGQKVGGQVETTASQISAASAAADLVSGNVQTLAAGVEEMGAAIREVARSAALAARVATNAVEVAGRTNETMLRLGDSSSEIGKVVKVITTIAQQTNLLALNATIEAARAGEAGKGFAIVANEVKDLAKETARATEDIHRRVEAIQTDTRVAVAAIEEIGAIIKQINELQLTIAGAVEEQTATASEIARNITDAARGSADIAGSISSVVDVTRETEHGADELLQAATALSALATELQSVTDTFRT